MLNELPLADILIVEDETCLRELLRMVLTREGYAVRLVKNGQEAVDYLTAGGRPSLILLDMMMPVLDGPGFLGWFQMNAQLAGKPKIVVLSAFEPQTRPDMALPGFDKVSAFVMKPVVVHELLKAIRQILQGDA